MKVTDSKNISSVSKKKKSSKSNKASGVSFDAMVDAVSGVENVEAAAPTSSVDAVGGIDADASGSSSYIPTDAEGRGNFMLESLEQLERDILAGQGSDAVEKLKAALATQAIDLDQIPPRLKEILDEIEMRASVEVAKMEAAQSNKEEEV